KIDQDRHHKLDHDGQAIKRLLLDLYLEVHRQPSRRIVIDLDAMIRSMASRKAGIFTATTTDPAICRFTSSAVAIYWREDQIVGQRCRRWCNGGGPPHRRAYPRSLARDDDRHPRRQWLLPRWPHELVRGERRRVTASAARWRTGSRR